MKYKIYVSHNAGNSYSIAGEADDPKEFAPLMQEFDDNFLRWYIEGPEGQMFNYISKVHKGLLPAGIFKLPGVGTNEAPKEMNDGE